MLAGVLLTHKDPAAGAQAVVLFWNWNTLHVCYKHTFSSNFAATVDQIVGPTLADLLESSPNCIL